VVSVIVLPRLFSWLSNLDIYVDFFPLTHAFKDPLLVPKHDIIYSPDINYLP
jgi:hypothetical protein